MAFPGRDALLNLWNAYQAHQGQVHQEVLAAAFAHPQFGPAVQRTPMNQLAQGSAKFHELLRGAVLDGAWEPWLRKVREHGATCARLGVPLSAWNELSKVPRRSLVPALLAAHGANPEQLGGALVALGELIDSALTAIAEQHAETIEQERSRLFVDVVKDYAIFMLDPQGRVTTWNEGAHRLKGYEAREIVGTHFSVFYPTDARAAGMPQRALDLAVAQGRAEDEGWRVRKDGSRFWANAVITALRDPRGELVGFAKVTRDLTERKRAEEAMRQSEESLATTLQSIGDGV